MFWGRAGLDSRYHLRSRSILNQGQGLNVERELTGKCRYLGRPRKIECLGFWSWPVENIVDSSIETFKTKNRDQKVLKVNWQESAKENHDFQQHWPRLRSQKEQMPSLYPLRFNQDRVSTIHKVWMVSDFGLDVLRLENDLDFDQLQLFYRNLQSCRTTILFCNKKTFNLSAFKNE